MIRICYPFIGDSVGGSHRSTLLLINKLDRSKFDPVIVVHEKGLLTDHLERNGIKYFLLPLPTYAGSSPKLRHVFKAILRITLGLRKFINENNISIVHGNDLRINLSWPLATRLSGASYIWHQRVVLSSSPLWKIIPLVANQVVCISNTVADCLPFVPSERLHTIINPFEVETVLEEKNPAKTRLKEKLGLAPDTYIVGFIGRMEKQKRPETFIKVAAKLQREFRAEVAFLMIGSCTPDEQSAIQDFAQQQGVEQLHILGFCDPIDPYLSGLDIVLSTGVNEGFGRVTVEAMLWNIPVIATDSGGHREIITHGQNGFLIPCDDDEAFAEYTTRLLRQPELVLELTGNANREARIKYTVESHVKQVMECYQEALSNIS